MIFPILLPTILHNLPQGYTQRLKQFSGEKGYSAKKHLGCFENWIDLEEVKHEYTKVRLFSQILDGGARRWFTSLTDNSILSYQVLEDVFKERWAKKKDPRRCFSQFYSIRREESESFQEFSDRFMKVYNDIPSDFKPPPKISQLQ